ncbi:MAG: hypothetical protein HDR29_05010 [Lachnospiraceae bacterium]|nr:hypothetical protein [Lachnospiraceae bacterium]
MNRINDIFLNQRNRIAALGVMALVWWCVFYPELCFPQDTYEVVNDEDTVEENYPDILQADDEQIVIGSRLLEWLKDKKN